MKVLIAYDGSECADAALDDLGRAGLPADVQAVIVTVAEPYGPVDMIPARSGTNDSAEDRQSHLEKEAYQLGQSAAQRLAAMFPAWNISVKTPVGAAQTTLVRSIEAENPDLAVVGSHGRRGFKRLILGSVSHHVVTHAPCSIRIGRPRNAPPPVHAPRIVVGTDGSDYAKAVLNAISARPWPAGTEVRIVSVVDSRAWLMAAPEAPGATYTPVVEERLRSLASTALAEAKEILSRTSLSITTELRHGMPGDVLVAEAEQWEADCIFVGAKGLNALARLLLGSVSTTVAVRAGCSVEVVRIKP